MKRLLFFSFSFFKLFFFSFLYFLCVVLVEVNFNHVVVCTVPMAGGMW